MQKIDLRTIEDLDRIGLPQARSLLQKWDLAEEIRKWIGVLAVKKIPFTTTFTWNEDRNHSRFHPSSLHNPCDMFLFLQYIGERETRKQHPQQAIFDTGTVLHLQMNYYMHTMAIDQGFVYNDEVSLWKTSRIAEELQLCGKADGVIERELRLAVGTSTSEAQNVNTIVNLRALVDWKSINNSRFSSIRSSVGYDYETQMHAYMATGNIPVTFVVYVNKDNTTFKSVPVFFTRKTWDPLADRLRRIIEIANKIQEPHRTVGPNCYNCYFYEKCEPDGMPRKRRNMESRLP